MKKDDKYSHLDELAAFGFIANALGGGGDTGQTFPQSDAEDFSRGLRFVPGEVTLARRRGEKVAFYQSCQNCCCWYWQFQDGSRTYYWERTHYENYGTEKCMLCGNNHVKGGHIKRGQL